MKDPARHRSSDFLIDRTAYPEWQRMTDLDRIRIELASRRAALNLIAAVRGGPFIAAMDGLTIEGTVGDGGFPIVVERLRRTPVL